MTIKEDFLPWQDKYGLTSFYQKDGKGGECGNGVRYTTEYLLCLLKYHQLDGEEWVRLVKVYESCEREPGLLMRSPDNTHGIQAADDTICALTASHLLGTDYAKNFLKYGRNNACVNADETDAGKAKLNKKLYRILSLFGLLKVRWVFNNQNPRLFHFSCWFGKMQQIIAHAQWAAGEKPNFLRRLWMAVTVLIAARSKHTDDQVLTWITCQVVEGESWMCDKAINYWRKRLRKRWPDGIGEVLGPRNGQPAYIHLKGSY